MRIRIIEMLRHFGESNRTIIKPLFMANGGAVSLKIGNFHQSIRNRSIFANSKTLQLVLT